MKILHQQYCRITAGEFKGKIFQLNQYHQHLDLAYFPGPPEQLISIEFLELVNMPFPYWRDEGGVMWGAAYPNYKRCDELSVGEQISLCAERTIKLKAYIKLHKTKLRRISRINSPDTEPTDQTLKFLTRDLAAENRLSTLLNSLVISSAPASQDRLKELTRIYLSNSPQKSSGEKNDKPLEKIFEPTQPEEVGIFSPEEFSAATPGRKLGSKNKKPAVGSIEIATNKKGVKSYIFRWKESTWVSRSKTIPANKLHYVESLRKNGGSIKQILDVIA